MSGRAGSGLAAVRLRGPAVSRLRLVGGWSRSSPRSWRGGSSFAGVCGVPSAARGGWSRSSPRPWGRTALVVCGQSCLSQCLKGLGGTPQSDGEGGRRWWPVSAGVRGTPGPCQRRRLS